MSENKREKKSRASDKLKIFFASLSSQWEHIGFMSNNRSDPVLFFRGTVVDMKDNKAPEHLKHADYKMLQLYRGGDWKYIANKKHDIETVRAKFRELTGDVEPQQPAVQQRRTNEVINQNLMPQAIDQYIPQPVPVDVRIDFLNQRLLECQQELLNKTQKCLDLEKQLQQVLALHQPTAQPVHHQQDESYWSSPDENSLSVDYQFMHDFGLPYIPNDDLSG